jgi:hypothetical protein
VTDSTAPSDHSAEAFGATLATLAAVELQAEGRTPAELNEIGRRAGEAIRDAARDRRELGLSEADTWLQTAVRSFVDALRGSGRR